MGRNPYPVVKSPNLLVKICHEGLKFIACNKSEFSGSMEIEGLLYLYILSGPRYLVSATGT